MGIVFLDIRQSELRGQEAAAAAAAAAPQASNGAAPDQGSRDLEEWPDAGEDDPSYLREEDAGQTVPR
jgi:hypothetical protein